MMSAGKIEATPMFIDGKAVAGASGEFIEVINPSTEEVVGRVPVATPEEIDAAVRSAHAAFKTWREMPAAERGGLMQKFVNTVRERVDDIGKVLTSEQGKPFPQAKGEIMGFCAVIEFYAQEARAHPRHGDPIGRPRQVRLCAAPADRRGGGYPAVERSFASAQPHDRAGLCRRVHGGRQAVVGHSADGAAGGADCQ